MSPLLWRFKLRQGVKFHDGSPFTADDVVFSIERGQQPDLADQQLRARRRQAEKVDDFTVEFQLEQVNPIFLEHMDAPLWIMSKAGPRRTRSPSRSDFKNQEETFASLNANGTGPFMLASAPAGDQDHLQAQPGWWGKHEGNVQEIVYTPIANDATRTAALISGEIDFVLDPPPRDVARLRNTPGVKVIDGPENRIIFIGMDQVRDELLYSSVKGKNPFKDLRVRRALYQAIDIETLKSKLMNGQSFPTGGLTPSPLGSYNDPAIEKRLPFDLAAARKLMADAGYATASRCSSTARTTATSTTRRSASRWPACGRRSSVKVKVSTMPRATYFPKLEKFDISMYMLGWGGAVTDAETTLTPVLRNNGRRRASASTTTAARSNDKADALAAQSSHRGRPEEARGAGQGGAEEYKDAGARDSAAPPGDSRGRRATT